VRLLQAQKAARSAEWHLAEAETHFRKGRYKKAIASLDELFRAKPTRPLVVKGRFVRAESYRLLAAELEAARQKGKSWLDRDLLWDAHRDARRRAGEEYAQLRELYAGKSNRGYLTEKQWREAMFREAQHLFQEGKFKEA